VFDYCLTFNLEVKHIWFSRWTIIKSIYVVMRYLPLLNMVGIMLSSWRRYLSLESVSVILHLRFLMTSNVCVTIVILTLRIWAIYARSVKIGIAMLLLFLGTVAISYANMHIFLKSLEYGHLDLPAGEMCVVVSGSRRIVINWIVLAIYDAGEACLWLLWTIYKDGMSGSTHHYQSVSYYYLGIIYYIYLMGDRVSIKIPFILYLLTTATFNICIRISHVIHSSLTARVILHAREQAEKQNSSACFTQMY
ncbi:hypothetical protein AMATHDRAFT_158301, partial [Amanita thiersii Skay4041]